MEHTSERQLAGPCPEYLLYVGTYTGGDSEGVYAFRYTCSDAGKLAPIGLVARAANPSFLAVHPNNRFVYVVEEIKYHEGEPTGLLSAYRIDQATGALKLLGKEKSQGSIPCHVSIDRTGKYVFAANYAGGTFAAFPVAENGIFGHPTAVVQHSDAGVLARRPHPHSVYPSCDRLVFVPDLGLDQLFVYRLCPDGGLRAQEGLAFELPPGSGPRHMAFHPTTGLIYLLNQVNSTIVVVRYDEAYEKFQSIQTISTLPEDFHDESSAAEIEIDVEGRFLYASNRGADTIAAFSIQDCGCLRELQQVSTAGKCPRHFAIAPDGRHLLVANQYTNNIAIFERDAMNGRLNLSGHYYEICSPACLLFVPRER